MRNFLLSAVFAAGLIFPIGAVASTDDKPRNSHLQRRHGLQRSDALRRVSGSRRRSIMGLGCGHDYRSAKSACKSPTSRRRARSSLGQHRDQGLPLSRRPLVRQNQARGRTCRRRRPRPREIGPTTGKPAPRRISTAQRIIDRRVSRSWAARDFSARRPLTARVQLAGVSDRQPATGDRDWPWVIRLRGRRIFTPRPSCPYAA